MARESLPSALKLGDEFISFIVGTFWVVQWRSIFRTETRESWLSSLSRSSLKRGRSCERRENAPENRSNTHTNDVTNPITHRSPQFHPQTQIERTINNHSPTWVSSTSETTFSSIQCVSICIIIDLLLRWNQKYPRTPGQLSPIVSFDSYICMWNRFLS